MCSFSNDVKTISAFVSAVDSLAIHTTHALLSIDWRGVGQVVRPSVIMSTRPGSHNKKKPAQKHKNNTAYKFDKYRTDPQAKILKSLQVLANNYPTAITNCCVGVKLLSQVHRHD